MARARSPAPPASAPAPDRLRAPARLTGDPPIAAPGHSTDRIVFEVDSLILSDAERLEITGRWFGVRGRVFVRPALNVVGSGAPARRLLAELGDKPWAALDGEPWRASFTLERTLPDDGALELSVAPDIVVTLRAAGGAQRARAVDRSPPIPLTRSRTRVSEIPPATTDSAETQRLAVDARRPTRSPARPVAGRAPEIERLTARLTNAEATLTRERERREQAELTLEQERATVREHSAELGRLRAELELARTAERASRTTADLLDASRRDTFTTQARYDVLAAEHERTVRLAEELRGELSVRESDLALTPRPEPPPHPDHPLSAPSPPHTDRPLNPALRSHGWTLRLLAVLVLAAVVIAVYLILQSTVLH